jgi:hypothetical protein
VLRHKIINKETKEQFQLLVDGLKPGQGILIIDFKENITLGRGPRELGQSWYTRERRTIFGMAFLKREADGGIKDLAIWCDNAPHFRNKAFLAYLLELIQEKEFTAVALCFLKLIMVSLKLIQCLGY